MPSSHLDLLQLYEDGQYSFQASDGSLIQIYYSFASSTDELVEARLAFYKVDQQSWDYEEATQDEDLVQSGSFGGGTQEEKPSSTRSSISWLRIDYSPKSAMGILHNSCHLHLSSFPSARLAVAGVPTPKQFMEFVMALCYPDIYRSHRLDNKGDYKDPLRLAAVNSDCVPFCDDLILSQITHIRIPGLPPASEPRSKRR
jgi:hypothetical protein